MPKLCTKLKKLNLLLVFWLAAGCASGPKPPGEVLSSPPRHISNGFKFLKKGYTLDARREFDLALQLDPCNSSAHRGLALVYCGEEQFEAALHTMQKAVNDASSGKQKALAYGGFMQIYLKRKDPGWFKRLHECYEKAVKWKNDLPETYFYMGLAYKEVNDNQKAEKAFKKVISLKQNFVMEAQKELSALAKPNGERQYKTKP